MKRPPPSRRRPFAKSPPAAKCFFSLGIPRRQPGGAARRRRIEELERECITFLGGQVHSQRRLLDLPGGGVLLRPTLADAGRRWPTLADATRAPDTEGEAEGVAEIVLVHEEV